MCPIGRKDELVDLKMCICRNVPFMFFLVAVTMAVVFNDAYFFYPLLCFKKEGLYFHFRTLLYTVLKSVFRLTV